MMKHASPTDKTQQMKPIDDKKPRGKHAAHAAPAAETAPLAEGGFSAFAPASDDAAQSAFQPATFGADEAVRAHRGRKPALIALSIIAVLLAATYFAGVFFFSGHFYPNTTMGERDISLESTADVESHIADTAADYSLHVTGWGVDLTLATDQIGLDLDGTAIVSSMMGAQNPWAWPVEVFQNRDLSESFTGAFDDTGVNDIVRAAVEEHNASAEAPQNATIGYSEEEGRVVVVPEVRGTMLDADEVVLAVDEAIATVQPTLRLTDAQLTLPEITSDDERLQAAADQATPMVAADVPLMMGGVQVDRLNGTLLTTWITLDENFDASISEDALAAWADGLISVCNTVGTQRTYTRPDGKTITIGGGSYGWEIDRDALISSVREAVAAGSTEAMEVPLLRSAAVFDAVGKPDWGSRYVDIDLAEQHVYFYDSGSLIWDSPCISGKTRGGSYDTSTGVFVLNAKQSPAALTGYENGEKIYETSVTYWMPFDRNVIGLHDANWQPWGGFYSGMWHDGYGSHGCVNLPPSAAANLYSMINVGDVVICHW